MARFFPAAGGVHGCSQEGPAPTAPSRGTVAPGASQSSPRSASRTRCSSQGAAGGGQWLLVYRGGSAGRSSVGGHEILNGGGQKPECWRPQKLVLDRVSCSELAVLAP